MKPGVGTRGDAFAVISALPTSRDIGPTTGSLRIVPADLTDPPQYYALGLDAPGHARKDRAVINWIVISAASHAALAELGFSQSRGTER